MPIVPEAYCRYQKWLVVAEEDRVDTYAYEDDFGKCFRHLCVGQCGSSMRMSGETIAVYILTAFGRIEDESTVVASDSRHELAYLV